MRNLLQLLYKYNYFILFLILEGLSIFIIVQGSHFHHARFAKTSRTITSGIYSRTSAFTAYIGLKTENRMLALENNMLRNILEKYRREELVKNDSVIDTINKQRYFYFHAKVVNNSVNKQYNYLTINRGAKDGVKPDMGVITSQGIVGIVEGVSANFSTVLSVLNLDFKVSAKIKKTSYYGQLMWDGLSTTKCVLNDIPQHVKFAAGDTITTGYSDIFPEDIPIGIIEEFDLKGGNFYTIHVKLFNDFRNISYINLISDVLKDEKEALENTTKND